MPPKVKTTKEDITKAALQIVRRNGAENLNARVLADELSRSTQPIFSNFATMDELRLKVVEKADIMCQEYIKNECESGIYPTYKATGMAYIRFAKEEKQLFKLLYMRDRTNEEINEVTKFNLQIEKIVKDNTGLETDNVKLFHLEMWAYVHGIATMFATGYLNLDWELVSKMLTDSYNGLRKQYGLE